MVKRKRDGLVFGTTLSKIASESYRSVCGTVAAHAEENVRNVLVFNASVTQCRLRSTGLAYTT